MKRITYILLTVMTIFSCKEIDRSEFMPFDEVSTYDYLLERREYEQWTKIIEKAGLGQSMRLKSIILTSFVADNEAVGRYLKKNGLSSIDELSAEKARALIQYHIIQGKSYLFSQFKDGRFPDTTASGDFLTTLFVSGENSGVFINGSTRLTRWDQLAINGVIHELEDVLDPIEGTMLDFIKNNPKYSIFSEAVALTKTEHLFSEAIDSLSGKRARRSMFIVTDSVYQANGIDNMDALKERIGATSDYSTSTNALNQYICYHLMYGNYTTLDFSTLLSGKHIDKTKGIVVPTQAANTFIHLKADKGVLLVNPESDGCQLNGFQYNMQVRNGMIHELHRPLFVSTPPPVKYVFDFADNVQYPLLATLENYRTYPARITHNLQKQDYEGQISWLSSPMGKGDAVSYIISNTGSYNLREFWGCNQDDAIVFDLGPVGHVSFQLPLIPAGNYHVKLSYQKIKNKGGNFQVYLGDKKFGKVCQGYVPSTGLDSWPIETLGDVSFATPVAPEFKCVVVKGGRVPLDIIIFEPF